MPRERSVGAVICNKGKYLLLHYDAGHWDFPKGNVEAGETEEQTARREVYEETGIKDIFLVKGFREQISYFYKKSGKTIYKEVIFFLFESHTKDVKLSKEHKAYAWLGFHEAFAKLTFQNAKDTLRKAHYFLEKAIRT